MAWLPDGRLHRAMHLGSLTLAPPALGWVSGSRQKTPPGPQEGGSFAESYTVDHQEAPSSVLPPSRRESRGTCSRQGGLVGTGLAQRDARTGTAIQERRVPDRVGAGASLGDGHPWHRGTGGGYADRPACTGNRLSKRAKHRGSASVLNVSAPSHARVRACTVQTHRVESRMQMGLCTGVLVAVSVQPNVGYMN